MIPPYALVAKLSGAHVEATIFSFSAAMINMFTVVTPSYMGVFWNKITFNVNQDNLDEMWKLYVLELALTLLCLVYVPLIPTWQEVEDAAEDIKRVNLDAQTPATARPSHGI